MNDLKSTYQAWSRDKIMPADYTYRSHHFDAFEAGWHARDEEVKQLRAIAERGAIDLDAAAEEILLAGPKLDWDSFIGILERQARHIRNALAANVPAPAASEAMRETERADGGGEELGGEDRPDSVLPSRFAPGTHLLWYPRSRSRPHYDERVLAVVVRDDGDEPWLMIRVRTKAGREIERWVERGELSFELTDEASEGADR